MTFIHPADGEPGLADQIWFITRAPRPSPALARSRSCLPLPPGEIFNIRRLHPRLHLVEDLLLRGEALFIPLRENLLVVDEDVEHAAALADDLAVDSEGLLDLSRQTGSSGEVISNAAVVDSNVHRSPLAFYFPAGSVLTRMAVTLSRPPRSFAVSISSPHAFSRSSTFAATSLRISSSGTMPVSPSEQRR